MRDHIITQHNGRDYLGIRTGSVAVVSGYDETHCREIAADLLDTTTPNIAGQGVTEYDGYLAHIYTIRPVNR